MKLSREELLNLYVKGAYRYEDLFYVNCMENKTISREHGKIIENIKSGSISNRDLTKISHIFDQVNIKIEDIIIV